MCFEGYKLFRLSLGIAGGVAGFVLAKILIELTGSWINWSETAKIIVLAVFTIVCGILAFTLYMKALIAITTIICAFWFYDDFQFLLIRGEVTDEKEIEELDEAAALQDVSHMPARVKCAVLGWKTMQEILEHPEKNEG